MTAVPRWIGLPVTAVLLVVGVLGVQAANGGGSFAPKATADPCVHRDVTSQVDGIDGLTEQLVMIGLDKTACRLHVSREALTLELAQSGLQTDAEVDALREGLRDAVQQMKDDGTLPPASDLVDDALAATDLDPLLAAAIRVLPDSVIDAALKTDDVLLRTIDNLDLRSLLANVQDQDDLNRQITEATTQAVKDSLVARVRDLL
ncbi:MAG: hypothetical protein QM714_02160 [Nocardioides sp.]|uniref:hypothetical protein n=1 Tax=Nocardioides sp. TaxID=35761 RepID=UPI0039E2B646